MICVMITILRICVTLSSNTKYCGFSVFEFRTQM
eukprot:UN13359